MCAKESWGRLSLLQHLKIHEGIEHQCDKCGYKSPSKKYSKDPINRIHSGIYFQCDQCKRAFTEKGCLRRTPPFCSNIELASGASLSILFVSCECK